MEIYFHHYKITTINKHLINGYYKVMCKTVVPVVVRFDSWLPHKLNSLGTFWIDQTLYCWCLLKYLQYSLKYNSVTKQCEINYIHNILGSKNLIVLECCKYFQTISSSFKFNISILHVKVIELNNLYSKHIKFSHLEISQ